MPQVQCCGWRHVSVRLAAVATDYSHCRNYCIEVFRVWQHAQCDTSKLHIILTDLYQQASNFPTTWRGEHYDLLGTSVSLQVHAHLVISHSHMYCTFSHSTKNQCSFIRWTACQQLITSSERFHALLTSKLYRPTFVTAWYMFPQLSHDMISIAMWHGT